MTPAEISAYEQAARDMVAHAVGERMPPPTREFRACWQCHGTKWTMDERACRICDYRGMLEYEVRR